MKKWFKVISTKQTQKNGNLGQRAQVCKFVNKDVNKDEEKRNLRRNNPGKN